ncbi:MAG: hypothetical protein K2X77_05815 [Candidatus Obscuribacterales bacterium]|jgi:hypothetical protein|nr:hypothetical protein [Candidatus Obscuribacterales bacterium]
MKLDLLLNSKYPLLACICFVLSMPSAGSLLTKVYGLLQMNVGVLYVAVPSSLVVLGLYFYCKRAGKEPFADLLFTGAFAGLIGTFAYDVSRVPFHLFGQRIFAPISAYGVWIADANMSSRFTEVIGWSYHFWNGIMFGVMYAMFMTNRAWWWAVIWGCLLETIAFVSPFGRIFGLWGNPLAIGIAYLGHVAYGIPLGMMIQKWEAVHGWMVKQPKAFVLFSCVFGVLALINPILLPENQQRDAQAKPGEFHVFGDRLNPDWQRISAPGKIVVRNDREAEVFIVKGKSAEQPLSAKSSLELSFDHTGVIPVGLKGEIRTRNSFVISEPVENP